MAMRLGALRDALIDAGAHTDKADKASEELEGFDTRFGGIEGKLAGIAARLTNLTSAVGIEASATLIILGTTFALWSRSGEISGQLVTIAHSVSH